jgi:FtsP/CotA-like multicopper oxidase with cupredoxin domain
MRARLMKVGAALAALGALAVGGSTLASAGSKQAPPSPPAAAEKAGVEAQQGADTDTLQQGDQSAPDTAAEAAGSESESASESSESGVSDGPGGYADSNANADTQQQGEN